MYYVRATALLAVLGSIIFAAGCSGGSGGATPPLPIAGAPGTPAAGPTMKSAATTTEYKLQGPIVAVFSNGFQMQGGSGIGYVDIYPSSSTQLIYNGLKPAVGEYAVVLAATSQGGSPISITLTTSQPSGNATPPPTSGAKLQGDIVALKTGGFQMQGGPGIGYVNIYPTSHTVLAYNGLKPAVGEYAIVEAPTTSGANPTWIGLYTSAPGGTPAPSPTPVTGGSVPTHVLTADVLYDYGGTPTTVPLSSAAPYLSWVQTSEQYAAAVRAAHVKVDIYTNFWRNYSSDNPSDGYTDLKPGGSHSAAEAKTCSGGVIYDPSYGGGYESDAYSSSAAAHAQVTAGYRESEYGSNYDAVFADDTGALGGLSLPCNYSDSTYKSSTNAVSASLGKPLFVNTLNAGSSVASQVGYATASNVIGAMCESCYAYWNTVNGVYQDFERTGSTWADTENGEALMVSYHKIFWDYARAIGNPATETGLRTYVYASFLLTYDPSYAMLQEAFKTNSGFPVMPETGLVPEQPLTTSSSVSGYLQSGGAYMRQFGACYYRGVNEGRCAVVVNPGSTSVTVPTTAYNHSMVLSGSGVLDGGTVSFAGSRPSSLAAGAAAILFP